MGARAFPPRESASGAKPQAYGESLCLFFLFQVPSLAASRADQVCSPPLADSDNAPPTSAHLKEVSI
jgi:hypothetical protein